MPLKPTLKTIVAVVPEAGFRLSRSIPVGLFVSPVTKVQRLPPSSKAMLPAGAEVHAALE